MLIEVKGLNEVSLLLKNFSNPSVYKPLLWKIGNIVRENIQNKTAQGIDYLNRPFQLYSDVYKKFKIKRGHTGDVNLWLTGQMLSSLSQDETEMGLIIHFDNSKAEKKAKHNQEGRVPRRFMGIGPDVEAIIDKEIEKYVDSLLGI